MIDSSLIQHPEKARDEAARQEQWLASEPAKSKARGCFAHRSFSTHPVVSRESRRSGSVFQSSTGGAGEVPAAMLHRYWRFICFCRPLPSKCLWHEGPSLHVITTGPVGKPLGPRSLRAFVVEGLDHEQSIFATAWETSPTRWIWAQSNNRWVKIKSLLIETPKP